MKQRDEQVNPEETRLSGNRGGGFVLSEEGEKSPEDFAQHLAALFRTELGEEDDWTEAEPPLPEKKQSRRQKTQEGAKRKGRTAPAAEPIPEAASDDGPKARSEDRLTFFEPKQKKRSFFDTLSDPERALLPQEPAPVPEPVPAAEPAPAAEPESRAGKERPSRRTSAKDRARRRMEASARRAEEPRPHRIEESRPRRAEEPHPRRAGEIQPARLETRPSAGERFAEDHLTGERPAGDYLAGERYAGDYFAGERFAGERSAVSPTFDDTKQLVHPAFSDKPFDFPVADPSLDELFGSPAAPAAAAADAPDMESPVEAAIGRPPEPPVPDPNPSVGAASGRPPEAETPDPESPAPAEPPAAETESSAFDASFWELPSDPEPEALPTDADAILASVERDIPGLAAILAMGDDVDQESGIKDQGSEIKDQGSEAPACRGRSYPQGERPAPPQAENEAPGARHQAPGTSPASRDGSQPSASPRPEEAPAPEPSGLADPTASDPAASSPEDVFLGFLTPGAPAAPAEETPSAMPGSLFTIHFEEQPNAAAVTDAPASAPEPPVGAASGRPPEAETPDPESPAGAGVPDGPPAAPAADAAEAPEPAALPAEPPAGSFDPEEEWSDERLYAAIDALFAHFGEEDAAAKQETKRRRKKRRHQSAARRTPDAGEPALPSSSPETENEPSDAAFPLGARQPAESDAGRLDDASSSVPAHTEPAPVAEPLFPIEPHAPALWDPLSLFSEPEDEPAPQLTPLSRNTTGTLPTLEELFGPAAPRPPVSDTSASDAPASDAPASDAPASDAPASDAPASDASASDASASAEPAPAAPNDRAARRRRRKEERAKRKAQKAERKMQNAECSMQNAPDAEPAAAAEPPAAPAPDPEPPVGAAIGRPPEAETSDMESPVGAGVPDGPAKLPATPDPEPPVGAAIGRPPEVPASEPELPAAPAPEPEPPAAPAPEPEPPASAAEPAARPSAREDPKSRLSPENWDPLALFGESVVEEELPSWEEYLRRQSAARAAAAAAAKAAEEERALAEAKAAAESAPGQWILSDPELAAAIPDKPAAAPAAKSSAGAAVPAAKPSAGAAAPDGPAKRPAAPDPESPAGATASVELPETPAASAEPPEAAEASEPPAPPEAPAPAEPAPTPAQASETEPRPDAPAEAQTAPMERTAPAETQPPEPTPARQTPAALTLEDFLAAAIPMEELPRPTLDQPPAEAAAPAPQTSRPARRHKGGRKARTAETVSAARENPEGLAATRAEQAAGEARAAQAAEPQPVPSADSRVRRRGAPRRDLDVLPPEEKNVLHPEEAYRLYARPLDEIGTNLILTGLLTLLSLFLTLYLSQHWAFLPEFFSGGATVYLLLGLLGLMVLVNRKLYFRDWRGEDGLRPELLLGLATLFTALDCFAAASTLRPPFTVVVGALLILFLWGRYDRGLALTTTVKVLRSEKLSAGVSEVPDITNGSRGLTRTKPDVDSFMARLETRDLTARVLRIYTPAAAIAGLVLTLALGLAFKRDLAWTGALIFLGSVPITGLLAFPRLFLLLSRRLAEADAALCGYHGAEAFGGEHSILIGDEDIFPEGTLTLNGFKVYNGNPDRMIAYAAAAFRSSGSALDPVFEDLLVTHNGRYYSVDNFRFYDSGGIGASIQQDVVLLGSRDFMRRMGVHMDKGTKVRQAVYMSLNGELAAVFAVRYAPPENLRRGLAAIANNRHFKGILVTRTFLGTPGFLKAKFGIPTGAFHYPSTKERIRLSEAEMKRSGAQGAILVKDSFTGFAQAAAGGRILRSTTLGAAVLTVLGGVGGLALMTVLAALPAMETATALNLLLYAAVWLAPTLLLTVWGRHF